MISAQKRTEIAVNYCLGQIDLFPLALREMAESTLEKSFEAYMDELPVFMDVYLLVASLKTVDAIKKFTELSEPKQRNILPTLNYKFYSAQSFDYMIRVAIKIAEDPKGVRP